MIEVATSTLFTDYFAGPSWEKKIVGTGTDGASTKVGENNGFAAKLRQRLDRPELVHCSAHRNELAYWLAGYSCTRKLMHCSFLCTSSIETAPSTGAASNKLGETNCMPSRVGGTRWVPHKSSFQCAEGIQGLVTHLSQVMNPDVAGRTTEQLAKAKNYYALLHSKDVVYFLHFLAEVTATLSDVSTAFQH